MEEKTDKDQKTQRVIVLQFVGGAVMAAVFHSLYDSAMAASFGILLGMSLVWLVYVVVLFFQKPRPNNFLSQVLLLIPYLGLTIFVGEEFRFDSILKSPVELSSFPTIRTNELKKSGASVKIMQDWMDAQIRSDAYPSLQIAMADTSGVFFAYTAGDPKHKDQNRSALYPVASVSKFFTNFLMIRLTEEGLLQPSDRLEKYLPPNTPITTNSDVGSRITLQMLATNTSGLVRGTGGPMRESDATYDGLQLERLYKQLGAKAPKFVPGTDRSYSNLGFGILGVALENVSGSNYRDLLHSRITKPFALQDTDVLDYTNPDQLQRLALPHLAGSGTQSIDRASLKKRLVGSGGIVSTASDLARLGSMLLTAERMRVPEENYTMYLSRVHYRKEDGSIGKASRYALVGRSVKMKNAGRCFRKNGGRNGVNAYVIICPKIGLSAAILTNRYVRDYKGSPDQIGDLIMEMLANQR